MTKVNTIEARLKTALGNQLGTGAGGTTRVKVTAATGKEASDFAVTVFKTVGLSARPNKVTRDRFELSLAYGTFRTRIFFHLLVRGWAEISFVSIPLDVINYIGDELTDYDARTNLDENALSVALSPSLKFDTSIIADLEKAIKSIGGTSLPIVLRFMTKLKGALTLLNEEVSKNAGE